MRNVSALVFCAVGSMAGEVGRNKKPKRFTVQTEIEWTVLGFLLDILFSGIGH